MKALSNLGFRFFEPLVCRPRSLNEVERIIKEGSRETSIELIEKTHKKYGFEQVSVGSINHFVVTHEGKPANKGEILRSISLSKQLNREDDYLRISKRILELGGLGLTLEKIVAHSEAEIIAFLKHRGKTISRSELRVLKQKWALAELYCDSVNSYHRGGGGLNE